MRFPDTLEGAASIVFAFDVGTRKTGVAIGNGISRTARPLAVVRGGRGRQLEAVAGLVGEWAPGLFVVGLPRHLDGKENAMTRTARRFALLLGVRFGVRVVFCDERLTTLDNPGADDAGVAAAFLQEWLEGLPPSGGG